jgi:hypothetical protein
MLSAKELKGLSLRERAIARAEDEELRIMRVKSETPYEYQIQSSSNPEMWHNVTLAEGGELEGAKCDCDAVKNGHSYCKHRAKAYLSFQKWLNTSSQAAAFKRAWRDGELTAPIAGRILQIRERRYVMSEEETAKFLKEYADLIPDFN